MINCAIGYGMQRILFYEDLGLANPIVDSNIYTASDPS